MTTTTFPPEVQAIIDRLATLTKAEAEQLNVTWIANYGTSWNTAWYGAYDAAWNVSKYAVKGAVWGAARDAVFQAVREAVLNAGRKAGQEAAWNAALAYLAGDAITAQQRAILAGPWEQVMA